MPERPCAQQIDEACIPERKVAGDEPEPTRREFCVAHRCGNEVVHTAKRDQNNCKNAIKMCDGQDLRRTPRVV